MPPRKLRVTRGSKGDCSQCKLCIETGDEVVQCDKCQKTLHAQCSDMDKCQLADLKANPNQVFVCHFCENLQQSSISIGLNEIKQKLNQLDDISKAMQFMSSQYDTILCAVTANKKSIEAIQRENRCLREEVSDLKSSLKLLNDERVQNDCVVCGISLCHGKQTAKDATLYICNKIGANIDPINIIQACFVGSKHAKSKTIIVRFANKMSKVQFMSSKSKLREITEMKNVFIHDCLSKETMKLLNHAKSLAKENHIVVKKNEQAPTIIIKGMGDVDKLLLASSTTTTNMTTSAFAADGDDAVS